MEFSRERVLLSLERYRNKRKSQFRALASLIRLDVPDLAESIAFFEAYNRVWDLWDSNIMDTPAFNLWLNTSRTLVSRGTHKALPIAHVREHLMDLSRFAVAASLCAGMSYQGRTRASIRGTITLPGTGIVLSAGRNAAGMEFILQTDGHSVAVFDGSQEATLILATGRAVEFREGEIGWAYMPQLGWGIRFNMESGAETFYSEASGRLRREIDGTPLDQWKERVGRACSLIELIESSLSTPVRELAREIYPLPPTASLSVNDGPIEAFGRLKLSLSDDTPMMAESLVRETAHLALNLLAVEERLWSQDHSGARFNSPWSNDPQPMRHMLHGVWAFGQAAEFWWGVLDGGCASGHEQRARARLGEISAQVWQALKEIENVPETTPAGQELEAALRLKHKLFAEIPGNSRAVLQSTKGVDLQTGGRAATNQKEEGTVKTESPARHTIWTKALGVGMPPAVNRLSDRVPRVEGISEMVMVKALQGASIVDEWLALSYETEQSEPESAFLVRGCIDYGHGNFDDATQCFASYVARRWEDVDAWNLLAAALRRSGRFKDAEVIVFRLADLLLLSAEAINSGISPSDPSMILQVRGETS